MTLTAHWTANTYTVTFDPDGGTVSPTSMQVTYGTQYQNLPVPTKEGAEFAGWRNGLTKVSNGDTVAITQNTTFVALWIVPNDTLAKICFHRGYGMDVTRWQFVTANSFVELMNNPFLRANYTFRGWATSSNSNVVTYQNGATIWLDENDLTDNEYHLWALWQNNGGSTMSTDPGLQPLELHPMTTQVETPTYVKTYTYDRADNVTGFTVAQGNTTV